MKSLKLILIMLFAFNITANALIRNVPSQYPTIQSAILSCSHGDTVLVQPGTYFENVIFRGKRIVLTSLYYQNNQYQYIQSTIINGSTPSQPDTASCVAIINGEDSTTVLQGFTLTGGTGTKWLDENGAGLYREGGGLIVALSKPVIQNNIIIGNQCITGGGAISTGGGGVRIGDQYVRFYNNVVMNNTARYGAGIVLNHAGGEYRNNLICKNYGSLQFGGGSGMWVNGGFTRPKFIENNTIVSNTGTGGTAGIYGSSDAVLRNNIVWYNTSFNTIQISGPFVVSYCNVQNGYLGPGNLNADPVFDTTNFYLAGNSPCIDAGDSSIIYNDPPDPSNPSLANWPARGTLRNDMGAYGGPRSKVLGNSIVSISGRNKTILPDNFYLKQNFPNPFNPTTFIEYNLGENSFVQVKIYNSLGKEVKTLVNRFQPRGSYTIEWNASEQSSGIYFYELLASSGSDLFSEKKKMILIK